MLMNESLKTGVDHQFSHPEATSKPTSKLPEVVFTPPIVNPNARDAPDKITDPEGYREFRANEIDFLRKKTDQIPHDSFSETMNAEMERLRIYYETLGKLLGVDLGAIARTRIYQLATVMVSSFVFLQNMFSEERRAGGTANPSASKTADGKPEVVTFFDSRENGGGMEFSANGGIEMAGYTAVFSVMKRKCVDDEGEYEIDYPVYSLPREVFVALQDWHEAVFPNQPFAENKLLKLGQKMMSRRVHDWIHAAILYDAKAITSSFKLWSDNSFFVEHLLDDPGMINYELLANNLHFEVWQDIYKQDPGAKDEVLGDVAEYTELVEMFSQWHHDQGLITQDEAHRMGIFMSYLGVRSTYDILRYDDKDLTTVIGQSKLAEEASTLLPPKTRKFLDHIYAQDQKLPFRMGSDQRLSKVEILNEYVVGLKDEAHAYRNEFINIALRTDFPQAREVPLAYEDALLAEVIQEQIRNLDLSKGDPRAYKRLNEFFAKINLEYGEEMADLMANLTDVDQDGYFYVRLNQNELDFSEATEVVHQKGAFLFQIPSENTDDITVNLVRVNTLISSQKGSQIAAKPGDVILVNTQNPDLVQQLLDEATREGKVDITILLARIKFYSEHGFSQLQDMYVYDKSKLVDTFVLPNRNSSDEVGTESVEVSPGYYVTKENHRLAMQSGPVSLDPSNKQNTGRHRITSGAVVKNHVQKTEGLDIFPVQEQSLSRFYNGAARKNLPLLKLNEAFYERHPMSEPLASGETDTKQAIREVLQATMDEFEKINNFLIFGTRGKPPKMTMGEVQELRQEHGTNEKTGRPPFIARLRQGLARIFHLT
jgi:hypothetical protein